MTLEEEILELITSKRLGLREDFGDFLIIADIFGTRDIIDLIEKSYWYRFSRFEELCFLFIGCDKKLSMCPACIVRSLEIVLSLDFYILSLALDHDECMSILLFVFFRFPYHDICPCLPESSLRVGYEHLFSHLIERVSIVIHEMAYICLSDSLLWYECEHLISEWRVDFISLDFDGEHSRIFIFPILSFSFLFPTFSFVKATHKKRPAEAD